MFEKPQSESENVALFSSIEGTEKRSDLPDFINFLGDDVVTRLRKEREDGQSA